MMKIYGDENNGFMVMKKSWLNGDEHSGFMVMNIVVLW